MWRNKRLVFYVKQIPVAELPFPDETTYMTFTKNFNFKDYSYARHENIPYFLDSTDVDFIIELFKINSTGNNEVITWLNALNFINSYNNFEGRFGLETLV